jgi:hypothetical protein
MVKHSIRQASRGVALLLVTSMPAFAVDVGQLEDLTGGAMPAVALVEHDRFLNEHIYSVKVLNQTGDPIVAGTLVVVLIEVLDPARKDILSRLEVLNKDGDLGDKPFFVIPIGGAAELPAYQESEAINVRLREPNYASIFPPSFRVLGRRRKAAESLEVLIQQLKNKGVLTEAEAQKALQPLRRPPQ